jgi:hypothetical protein
MNTPLCNKCKKRPVSDGRKRCNHCRRAPRSYATRMRAFRKGDEGFRLMRKMKAREKRKQEKDMVVAKLGGKCACCGESQREFLTIDHISGDGAAHRKTLGVRANNMASFCGKLLREGRTEGIQVLCANCHLAKDMHGGCPHELERRVSGTLDSIVRMSRSPNPDRDAVIAEAVAILRGHRSKVGPVWTERNP